MEKSGTAAKTRTCDQLVQTSYSNPLEATRARCVRVYYSIMTTEVPLLTARLPMPKGAADLLRQCADQVHAGQYARAHGPLRQSQEKLGWCMAGTSGKTSTSYYAAALLRAAGLQVGLR